MPIIDYAGHKVRIDHIYSWSRVSSTQQTDGEGLERQMRRTREFAERHGIPIDQELCCTASASKGYHIQRGRDLGPLGVFLEAAERRLLKPYPALTVESFSRLCRLENLDALKLFEQIVNRDVALVTLTSQRIYTRLIVNRDPGILHTVLAELASARADAESKSDYSRYGYRKRRGAPTRVCVGWLRLKADRSGYEEILPEHEAILLRIFLEVQYLSVDQVAARLNAECVPVFESWNHAKLKRRRWHGSYITKIVRSRAVRGEVQTGSYGWEHYDEMIEGKRVEWRQFERSLTGEFEQKYPVIVSITDELWLRANAALDARKTGRGPKGEDFANLLQGIAKCAHCGASMKLISTAKQRRGRERRRYHYYRCAAGKALACHNRHTYDYGAVEREFLDVFQEVVAAYLRHAEPDATAPLRAEIAAKQAELHRLDQREKAHHAALQKAQEQTGATDDEVARLVEGIGLGRQKAALLTEIVELERKLPQVKAQVPPDEVAKQTIDLVATLASVPKSDLRTLRSKINGQLKRFIARIKFDSQGTMRVIYGDDQGRELQPSAAPNMAFRTDYTIRFGPEVQREHPALATTRPAWIRLAAGLPDKEIWQANSRQKLHLRPDEKKKPI